MAKKKAEKKGKSVWERIKEGYRTTQKMPEKTKPAAKKKTGSTSKAPTFKPQMNEQQRKATEAARKHSSSKSKPKK